MIKILGVKIVWSVTSDAWCHDVVTCRYCGLLVHQYTIPSTRHLHAELKPTSLHQASLYTD